jgi:hypothetical protein
MNTPHKISSTALESVLMAPKNNMGASFTLRSHKTGRDYTYRIKRDAFNGNWYTHIYVEKTYLHFDYLGMYENGTIFRKKVGKISTSAAIHIAMILQKVEEKAFTFLDEKIDVFHLGCCIRCGQTLTDAVSIEHGLGPICRKKIV